MEDFLNKNLDRYISDISDLSTLAKDSVYKNDHLKAAEEILLEAGLEDLIKDHKLEKSETKAAEFKEIANNLLSQEKYIGAIVSYNAVICYAPPGSESIGVAYANRSVVYMQLGYFKLALENIQLARKYNYPEAKLEKLAGREERCLQKIRERGSKENSYQGHKDAKEKLLKPTLPPNPNFPFYMAYCLTIEKSEKFGKHIRTTEDLKVGTIVAVEKPLVSSLVPKLSTSRCEFCRTRLILTSELLPCDYCARALYCSEKCKMEAREKYHKMICLRENNFCKEESTVFKLFCVGLSCFQRASDFTEFLRKTKKSDDILWNEDLSGLNEKEVSKKIIQAMNSFKAYIPPKKDQIFTGTFKRVAMFTSICLNFTKLKKLLTTEDDKKMFRRFVQHQFNLCSYFYMNINEWSRLNVESNVKSYLAIGSNLTFTYLSHSCVPNIRCYYSGSEWQFIVLRPIKKGEQLFIGRGEMFGQHPVDVRRKFLLDRYNFFCQCDACEHPRYYPLEQFLPKKDRAGLLRVLSEIDYVKTSEFVLESTVRAFPIICRYMHESDARYYPCYEINTFMHPLFQTSIMTFNLEDDFM